MVLHCPTSMIGSLMQPSALILLLLTQASFLVQRADAADTGAAIPLHMRRARSSEHVSCGSRFKRDGIRQHRNTLRRHYPGQQPAAAAGACRCIPVPFDGPRVIGRCKCCTHRAFCMLHFACCALQVASCMLHSATCILHAR